MQSLIDVLQDPARRQAVVSDVETLVDQQVKSQRGASGFAIKGGYKVVSQLRGGNMISAAIGALIDDFARAIEPLHAEYRDSDESSFSSFLKKRDEQAANALLGITDERIDGASSVVAKTYRRLRPMAKKQVAAAAPDIGAVVERHTS
jgi:hypothetical protein